MLNAIREYSLRIRLSVACLGFDLGLAIREYSVRIRLSVTCLGFDLGLALLHEINL